MHEEYRKLIEAKGGIVLKTERRDTRNRHGEMGWVGTVTTFLLDGRTWEYRTGQVISKRNYPASYHKVVTYEGPFDSVDATEFFKQLQ